ncbi:MAG: SagB/ThcOx family dehydrogenase [Veillonellaceae bacterium]|nr:SagB/ThcOx family dehydrogenase [Veillonellaceae bacterium]
MNQTGTEFIRRTYYEQLTPSDQSQGLPPPELESPYTGPGPVIHLTKPDHLKPPSVLLENTITGRRSIRRFSPAPLTLEEMAWLLWCTQGVQQVLPLATIRTVPSAGARHPLDTYVLINHVKGLNNGLYRYIALEHAVAPLRLDARISQQVQEACLGQDMVSRAALGFFWVADVYRSAWRYSERAWRYVFLDAGHVCQNLYLGAAPLECGVCAIAAFDDEKLNSALEIDGENRFAVYAAVVGKLPAR